MKLATIILGFAAAVLAVEQVPGPIRRDRNNIRNDKSAVRHDDRRINRDERRINRDYRDGASRGQIRNDKYRLDRAENRLGHDQRDVRRDYRQYHRVRSTDDTNETKLTEFRTSVTTTTRRWLSSLVVGEAGGLWVEMLGRLSNSGLVLPCILVNQYY
jgi:hypothetical protein